MRVKGGRFAHLTHRQTLWTLYWGIEFLFSTQSKSVWIFNSVKRPALCSLSSSIVIPSVCLQACFCTVASTKHAHFTVLKQVVNVFGISFLGPFFLFCNDDKMQT